VIEAAEGDPEVEEAEEEVEEAVDLEEDGDEAAEEDSKNQVEWMTGRFDDHYIGNGDKT